MLMGQSSMCNMKHEGKTWALLRATITLEYVFLSAPFFPPHAFSSSLWKAFLSALLPGNGEKSVVTDLWMSP